jgi:hypothetical protein
MSADAAGNLSRRTVLGAAAVVAGSSLSSAPPAVAGSPSPWDEGPFGPVIVTDPGGSGAYARAVRLGHSRNWLASKRADGRRQVLSDSRSRRGPG